MKIIKWIGESKLNGIISAMVLFGLPLCCTLLYMHPKLWVPIVIACLLGSIPAGIFMWFFAETISGDAEWFKKTFGKNDS